MARLVDRLVNRLGPEGVYRAAPVETPIPERLAGKRSALEPTRKPAPRSRKPTPPPSEAQPVAIRPGPVLKLVASTPEPESGATDPRQAHRSLHLVPVPEPEQATDEPRVVPAWMRPKNRHRRLTPDLADIHGHLDRNSWPRSLKPPVRLLAPPRPITAIAGLPNEAPATFTWRRRHRVLRSEGPERIVETWWHGDHESDAIRDYFEVEVEGGQRFWLFRRGNGSISAPVTSVGNLHGVF